MNFLICPAADYQLDDTEGMFQSPGGSYFNFKIELIENEMIRIHDTCGRYVPIDIADVAAFGDILSRIAAYTESKQELQQDLIDTIFHGAEH